MAYKPLPIVEVHIDKLRLDLQNYRIPIAPDDEAAALNYLFAAENVLDQIRLFLRDGYFDNEVPIAVREDGAFVVLEGNRRVSALKAIANPAITPTHRSEVEELRTRYATEVPSMPTKIRVIVAPDRDAPRKHIARLHTGVPKKRWSRDQQANYYYSLLGPNVTVKDLKALYPDVEVVRFLRMVAMRRFLSGVKFKDKALRDYVVSAALTMSSFEYAYRNAAIAASIGVRFDADGRIEPARRKPERIGASLPTDVRDALEYLMNGFRSGHFNTRSAEFKAGSEEQVDLLARLLGGGDTEIADTGAAPDGADSTTDTSSDAGDGSEGSSTSAGGGVTPATSADVAGGSGSAAGVEEERGQARGPNDPDTLQGLSVGGLPFAHVPSNLSKRTLELRRISVKRTPAAAAMLLRSVLEATIKWHFEGTATPVTGMLSQVFPAVVSKYGNQRQLRDSINAINSGSATKPGSINWFNAAAHNPHLEVTPGDVRSAYSLVQPVLIRLMRPA